MQILSLKRLLDENYVKPYRLGIRNHAVSRKKIVLSTPNQGRECLSADGQTANLDIITTAVVTVKGSCGIHYRIPYFMLPSGCQILPW